MAEQGYPEFDATTWNGFFVPASTPKAVVTQLNTAIEKRHLAFLPGAAVTDLDQPIGQAPPDHDGDRHSEQFRIGELHSGAGFAIIVEDVEPEIGELPCQVLGGLEHFLALAGDHHLHLVGSQLHRPREALVVAGRQLSSSRGWLGSLGSQLLRYFPTGGSKDATPVNKKMSRQIGVLFALNA